MYWMCLIQQIDREDHSVKIKCPDHIVAEKEQGKHQRCTSGNNLIGKKFLSPALKINFFYTCRTIKIKTVLGQRIVHQICFYISADHNLKVEKLVACEKTSCILPFFFFLFIFRPQNRCVCKTKIGGKYTYEKKISPTKIIWT